MVFKVTKCMLPDDKQIYFCREHMSTVSFLYYLKHEQECFIRYEIRERSSSVLYLIKQELRTFEMA